MLTRYMIREFAPLFLMSNGIILFILSMFQVVRIAELILSKTSTGWESMSILISLMTSFLPASIPISCLACTNMMLARMTQDSELIALVSSGVPARRLLWRFLTLGGIVSIVMLWLSLTGVPRANEVFNNKIAQISARAAAVALKPGVFIEGFHGLLLYLDAIDSRTQRLTNVFAYDSRDAKLPMTITGPQAELVKLKDDLLAMRFFNGELHINRGANNYQKILFQEYQINIPLNMQFDLVSHMPLGMNHERITREINLAKEGRSEWDLTSLQLELYRRYFLPIACFLFVILGFLWGIGHHRNIRGRPVITSLLITAVYWTTFLTFDSMAREGKIPVLAASWAPNLCMAVICLLLFLQKRRFI